MGLFDHLKDIQDPLTRAFVEEINVREDWHKAAPDYSGVNPFTRQYLEARQRWLDSGLEFGGTTFSDHLKRDR